MNMRHYSDEELILFHYGEARRPAQVERHLQQCESCASTSGDITRVLALADGENVPARDDRYGLEVWQRIRHELPVQESSWPARGLARWWTWMPATGPWAAAIAAAVMVALIVAAGVVRLRRPALATSDRPAATVDARDLALSVESELQEAEQHYQRAIAGLEAITQAEQGRLDPTSAATLAHNLAVIDQAIAESRAAMKAQPDSALAQQSLLDGLQSKVGLLQAAVELIMMANDTQDDYRRAPGAAARGRG
jgi:hypothetical protein